MSAEAEARAEATLMEHLNPMQQVMWQREGAFEVAGAHVSKTFAGIRVVQNQRKFYMAPRYVDFPCADVALSAKLLLEGDPLNWQLAAHLCGMVWLQ